jgi:diadenosine tetraphosphatase ApaH/serine/threonine PP2A family protein phosphatase
MKFGIFSDIHGNLEGLERSLSAMSREGVSRYWCLGDIVGYGANPNECVDRVRETADAVVLGNHDAACVGLEDVADFNPFAREAVRWTAAQLTENNKNWLRKLPLTRSRGEALLVHGSPFDPGGWHYVTAVGEVVRAFAATPARLIFMGHSHQPVILATQAKECRIFGDTQINLAKGSRYLVNAGSTGQPRDGDPRAGFVIYDNRAQTMTVARVAYDLARAQRKIRAAGLPDILASRLETGT